MSMQKSTYHATLSQPSLLVYLKCQSTRCANSPGWQLDPLSTPWLSPVPECVQANTTAVVLANKAMNHVEGGWPKEVDCSEAEHVIRYRKKVTLPARGPCSSGSAKHAWPVQTLAPTPQIASVLTLTTAITAHGCAGGEG